MIALLARIGILIVFIGAMILVYVVHKWLMNKLNPKKSFLNFLLYFIILIFLTLVVIVGFSLLLFRFKAMMHHVG